jgi:hypothetical protein
MTSQRRALAAGLVATTLTAALAGCGGSAKPQAADDEISATPTAQVTADPPSGAKVIHVTVEGQSVTPDGGKVEVKKGQPVVFEIQADTAGEVHVHSSPATAISYPAGASRASITIKQPGIIEVEIEQLGKPVAQLEVR